MMMVTASASHGDDIGSSRIVGLLVLVFSAQSRGQSRKGLMLMEDKRPNCSSQKRIVVVATRLEVVATILVVVATSQRNELSNDTL